MWSQIIVAVVIVFLIWNTVCWIIDTIVRIYKLQPSAGTWIRLAIILLAIFSMGMNVMNVLLLLFYVVQLFVFLDLEKKVTKEFVVDFLLQKEDSYLIWQNHILEFFGHTGDFGWWYYHDAISAIMSHLVASDIIERELFHPFPDRDADDRFWIGVTWKRHPNWD